MGAQPDLEMTFMLKKILHSALAAGMALTVVVAATQPAEAHRRGFGPGLAVGALLGLGIAGAYAGPRYYYDDGPACYRGPRQCEHVGRSCWYNSWGERVCRGGEYRCWRPTVCD
jgi:hypothetical protein